jgi:hypothetical protein
MVIFVGGGLGGDELVWRGDSMWRGVVVMLLFQAQACEDRGLSKTRQFAINLK